MEFSESTERKIKYCILDVQKAIQNSMYIDEDKSWKFSFENNKKIFIRLSENLFFWDVFKEFQDRLSEIGISSEVCFPENPSDKSVVVWKKEQ